MSDIVLTDEYEKLLIETFRRLSTTSRVRVLDFILEYEGRWRKKLQKFRESVKETMCKKRQEPKEDIAEPQKDSATVMYYSLDSLSADKKDSPHNKEESPTVANLEVNSERIEEVMDSIEEQTKPIVPETALVSEEELKKASEGLENFTVFNANILNSPDSDENTTIGPPPEMKKFTPEQKEEVKKEIDEKITDVLSGLHQKPEYVQLVDIRDGQAYKTVQIGNQVWFAENLRYSTKNAQQAGNPHPLAGLLYNWDDAKISCPEGWHLPTEEEWKELFDYLRPHKECKDMTAVILKSSDPESWANGGCGKNVVGFDAIPTGVDKKDVAWWTATEFGDRDEVVQFCMQSDDDSIAIGVVNKNIILKSVRCVKD